MNWGAPGWLGLLILPALAALVLARRRPANARGGAAGLLRVSVVGRQLAAGRPEAARRPWWLLVALAMAMVALARPRWGEPRDVAIERGREVLIALDLSRSMLVDDAGGTRLERARELLGDLLDRLPGERVGLILFAGSAYVQVPLSSDYQILREFLPMLEPDYMPQGGSDYTGMLKAALDGFSQNRDTDRFLLVLSDGESTTEGWREQLVELARREVRVLAFAVGSESGGLVPAGDDAAGDEPAVISKLQPATLRALAASSRGVYENVSATTDVSAVLAATVERGRKGRYERLLAEARPERFQWFLVPAALGALAGLWREVAVRPRWRRAVRVARAGARELGAPVLLVGVGLGALGFPVPVRAHDEVGDEKVSFAANVESTAAQRLLVLVEHLARNGYDAEDVRKMAEETVNYGIEAQARGLTLQPGAVTDAIAATHEAEKTSPQLANWNYLRAQLEKLLEPPADLADAERKKKPPVEAMDEEDKPTDMGEQGTQQSTADGGGRGGPNRSDAEMGELQKNPRRLTAKSDLAPVVIRPLADKPAYEAESGPVNSVRALTLRSLREAIKDDSPGKVHRSMQGTAAPKAEEGRDY